MKIIKTDCLVIGSGLAGSVYAYSIAKKGIDCVMICAQKNLTDTNSNLAQGGVIYEPEPNLELLIKDIDSAGAGLGNIKAMEQIAAYGCKFIKEIFLGELNTPFDKDKTGNIAFTMEGAHSKARVIYAKDNTGEVMLDSIHSALKKFKNLKIRTGLMAANLLTLSHNSANPRDRYKHTTCFGAYVLDTKTGEVMAIVAKKTILATGGLGQIYQHTTNHPGAFGHGVSLAYRIGARVMNMEYIQFHPTAFYKKRHKSFLISEALRGEGGVLVNADGKTFIDHPKKSLAPRDVVSRAISEELLKTGESNVYMDLSALRPDYIKKRFPHIYQKCLDAEVDITKEPIPVVPAVHYSCGGVFAGVDGRTNISNLNVIGESACTGLHGANRLASTSLLECIAMGGLCAQKDACEIENNNFYLPEPQKWISPKQTPDINLIAQDLKLIQDTMWNYVGIIRNPNRLSRANKILRGLKKDIEDFYREYRLTPELLNLRSAITCARLVVYAAHRNTKSCGCHYVSK